MSIMHEITQFTHFDNNKYFESLLLHEIYSENYYSNKKKIKVGKKGGYKENN